MSKRSQSEFLDSKNPRPSLELPETKKKTADNYTKLTTFVDGLSTVFGSFFTAATITEMVSQDPKLVLIVGGFVAVCGFGSTYSHANLNTHMQEDEPLEVPLKGVNAPLKKGQYVALAGDYLSHGIQYFVPLYVGTYKFIEKLGLPLSDYGKLAIDLGFLVLSCGGAIGNVRTCANAMKQQNMWEFKPETPAGEDYLDTPVILPTSSSINYNDKQEGLLNNSQRSFGSTGSR